MRISTLLLLMACSTNPKPEDPSVYDTGASSDNTDTSDTDTSDTDTSDTDTSTDTDTDSIEDGRTGSTVCAAGGHVQGSSVSGSFCLGAVDISPSTQSTSASFQWQPGPTYTVSP
ncbi:MAG: hypothetical protein VXZ96_06985 [Myxococcota bacterium]|nr:hypothetical protein [Myxococcota bacterium]MEC8380046.1 hypothetical protein [Myxococcota bacterium]